VEIIRSVNLADGYDRSGPPPGGSRVICYAGRADTVKVWQKFSGVPACAERRDKPAAAAVPGDDEPVRIARGQRAVRFVISEETEYGLPVAECGRKSVDVQMEGCDRRGHDNVAFGQRRGHISFLIGAARCEVDRTSGRGGANALLSDD
jgi:hypothetical protein